MNTKLTVTVTEDGDPAAEGAPSMSDPYVEDAVVEVPATPFNPPYIPPTLADSSEPSTPDVSDFTDLVNDWYRDAVGYVVENGLMAGTSATTFEPEAALTRGMVMTILARLYGVDTTGSAPWYQIGVDWAVESGLSDGTYPEAQVTREQMVTMLWRYAGEPAADASVLTSYPDAASISTWAEQAMAWAASNKIIIGTDVGTLNSNGFATRAEVAIILMRFCTTYLGK